MKNTLFAFAALALSAIALSGCGVAPPAASAAETFSSVRPVVLNVASIEVIDRYSPPMGPPNVDHLFPTPPRDAILNLLGRELVATGAGSRVMRVIISDASVTTRKLPVKTGLIDKFKREPSEIYTARAVINFEIADASAPDIATGRADVIAERSKTLLTGDSPAERDRAAFDLTRDLMRDVSSGLQTTVRNTFGGR